MKNVHLFGILFLFIALCLGSCSKTGPAGPQGEQGPQGTQGEQGPTGPQGIAGADGSTIYSNSGAPTTDVGKNGDYYLDKGTGNLYGPKTDNGWGNPVSLKGQKGDKGVTGATGSKGAKGDPGQDGKDGSQILSGTSVPSASIGNIGDYYWNTSNFTLYGPKTSSGWGSGVMLRGPKGEKGDPGTANVMYSDWMKIDWNGGSGLMRVGEPKLTASFFSHGGIVLTYLLFSKIQINDTMAYTIFPLPKFIQSNVLHYGYGKTFNCSVSYQVNPHHNIELYVTTTDGSALPSPFLQDDIIPEFFPIDIHYRFRYILIPGGVHLRKSSPAPDPKDYKATCAYYGIAE